MSKYFKEKYDVIIIGASLAGLSAALTLLKEGYDVLVLEQHNLPGGVATSFVRSGVEIEASLHEMMGIGTKENPQFVRKFLEENDIYVDWIKLPMAYRYIDKEINVLVHFGEEGDFSVPAKEIAEACLDKNNEVFNKLMAFFQVCKENFEAMSYLTSHKLSNLETIKRFPNFVKTLGYSYLEVAKGMGLPQKAIDILSGYWIYLGSPTNDLPFSIYSYILTGYLGYGSYIPRHTSYEMSVKLLNKVESLGAQVEFAQKVSKILVKNNEVEGVKLKNGEIIYSKNVIAGPYPNTVFLKMIEPKEEIPEKALKWVNSMELGISCFSITMLLDQSYQELGLVDYATFYAPNGLHIEKTFKDSYSLNNWDFLTCISINTAHEDASPKGTCLYTITYLPKGESFLGVTKENYEDYKQKNIDYFLDEESKRLGIDLRKHIIDMVVETPITISHYTDAYFGNIYGYQHKMNNHVVARNQQAKDEHFIKGLAFAGAHQVSGDGMAPAFSNGVRAALEILEYNDRKDQKRDEN